MIYAGLLITIGFSYFFGLEAFASQALMCAIFSTLLGLTILAILELAHPYQGTVVVSAQPLEYALSRMDDMDKISVGSPVQNPLAARDRSVGARRSLRPGASPSSVCAASRPAQATSA